jgi:hypothetical protein
MGYFKRTPSLNQPYHGKKIVISTMHLKNTVIGSSLKRNLGASHMVPIGLNTDVLGTFTGEIERSELVLATAIAKARLGMVKSGVRYGIASEGSYGPHPDIPFLYAGFELMVLVDDLREIVIAESLIDEEPKYFNTSITPDDGAEDDLEAFLLMAGFPDHALIVRPNCWDKTAGGLAKGLRDRASLHDAIRLAASLSQDGKAFVQNDMRAHMNPTRMQKIAHLADALCARIKQECPACGMPGFGKIKQVRGLPCRDCDTPTELPKGTLLGCVSCDHTGFEPREDMMSHTTAQFCPSCNP